MGKQIAWSALAESARQRVVKMAVVNCIVEKGLLMRLRLCWISQKRSVETGNKDTYIYIYIFTSL